MIFCEIRRRVTIQRKKITQLPNFDFSWVCMVKYLFWKGWFWLMPYLLLGKIIWPWWDKGIHCNIPLSVSRISKNCMLLWPIMYLLSAHATYFFLRTWGSLTAQHLIPAVTCYLQEYLKAAESNLPLVSCSLQRSRVQPFILCGQLQQNLACVWVTWNWIHWIKNE